MASSIALTDFEEVHIFTGAKFKREYELSNGGVPEDITGATIEAEFVDDMATPNVVFTAPGTIIDAVNGKFSIDLTEIETAAETPVILNSRTTPEPALKHQFQRLAFYVYVNDVVRVYGTANFYHTGK